MKNCTVSMSGDFGVDFTSLDECENYFDGLSNLLTGFAENIGELRDRTMLTQARNTLTSLGLDDIDNKILTTIIDKFQGGPVGIGTIATAIGEDAGTVEDVYEPYLIMEGFLKRTSRGRMATELAYNHLGRDMYRTNSNIISPSFFD
jgi:hypothetical protein